jgi:hypothetical protein
MSNLSLDSDPRKIEAPAAPVSDVTPPQPSAPDAAGEALRLPPDVLPVLPLRNTVLFPTMVIPLGVGRERSRAGVQYAMRTQSPVAVLLQREADNDDPKATISTRSVRSA